MTKRFTTGGDAGAPQPGLGPSFGLQGHVALLPMVRAGLYAEQDVSPASDAGPRMFWAGGVHVRATPPLLPSPWRAWVFAGAGVAYAYSKAVHAAGALMDVPLGVGLGSKLGGHLLLFGEVGARWGLLFQGAMYDAAGAPAAQYLGRDSFALTASLGLSWER